MKPILPGHAHPKPNTEQKQPGAAVSQLSRRARSQQLAENQTQVEGANIDQLPLENIFLSAQRAASHATSFIAVGKDVFD
ncbi:MAG: hypothetical protein ACYDC6_16205 [Acidobacteriaceae bacterium]